MADLSSIASLATAGGTLVLGVATFASVRSANRAARVAEQSLLLGLRPVLAQTRFGDPEQKIGWGDQHWTRVAGGFAGVEATDEVLYFSLPLRNVGNGIAILNGWHVHPFEAGAPHAPVSAFVPQQRALYVPPNDVGFWQGALRDPAAPEFAEMRELIERRERFSIDVLYSDHEGGQPAIARFGVTPAEGADAWLAAVSQHWRLANE